MMLLGILSPWTRVSIWGDLYWTWQSWVKVCGLRICMGHGSSQMAEFKDHLSLQRDFYPIKEMGMHPVTWCITFWDTPQHLSNRLSSIFLSLTNFVAWAASWRMNAGAYCPLFDAVSIFAELEWFYMSSDLRCQANLYCKYLYERAMLCGSLWPRCSNSSIVTCSKVIRQHFWTS